MPMLRPHLFLALLPVLAFLAALVSLDSYKLVRLPSVLFTIVLGCVSAVVALGVNGLLADRLDLAWPQFVRYVSPVPEEALKATFLVLFFARNRIGFMVDAAIRGFALGAGFATLENLYYLWLRPEADLSLWVIRGFGTAMMHGGVTAVVGIVTQSFRERQRHGLFIALLPGLIAAIAIHSFFNHFLLGPLLTTVLILVILPLLVVIVFQESERRTRQWLGVGFDSDQALLGMVTTGVLAENRIGAYLHSLQGHFPGEVVADMLCYLRIHLELALRAKGMLLMREAGFEVPPDPAVRSQFEELRYLEKSIGTTGKLALHPFLYTRTRDLWQMMMLR
jgi:RsiW-degrading membrane proteinase PrsW (M82 family)